MKLKWIIYLKFTIYLSIVGLAGFFFLVMYDHFKVKHHVQSESINILYWIGYVLSMIEIVVFEMINGIFLLHCFFLELF